MQLKGTWIYADDLSVCKAMSKSTKDKTFCQKEQFSQTLSHHMSHADPAATIHTLIPGQLCSHCPEVIVPTCQEF